MTGNEYQKLAARTINIYLSDWEKETHSLFGMASEVGELHSLYQKVHQGLTFDVIHAKKELGDLMWFIAEWCTANDIDLEEIMELNIVKLRERYPNGFDEEKSLHRKDGDI